MVTPRWIGSGLLCALALSAAEARALPQDTLSSEEQQAWVEDIDELERLLVEKHADLSRALDLQEFHAFAQSLRSGVGRMTRAEVIIGLAELTALTEDGHTGLSPGQEAAGFRKFPFRAADFADGFFITVTTPKNEEFLGQRLVAINDVSVDEIFERILNAQGGENAAFRRHSARG